MRSSNEHGLINLFYLLLRWLSLCLHYCFFSFLCYLFLSSFPNTLLLSPPVHVWTSLLPPNSLVRLPSTLFDWSSCFLFNGIDTLLIFLFWPCAIVVNQVKTQHKAVKYYMIHYPQKKVAQVLPQYHILTPWSVQGITEKTMHKYTNPSWKISGCVTETKYSIGTSFVQTTMPTLNWRLTD